MFEDDPDISKLIGSALDGVGYSTTLAYSGTEALMRLEKSEYDLIISDLMLLGLNGEEIVEKVEIQIAYAIGVARPVSVYVDSFGTAVVSDSKLQEIVLNEFDFRPASIIHDLNLHKPVYAKTAAYGHFGRSDTDFAWEQTSRIDKLKKYVIG